MRDAEMLDKMLEQRLAERVRALRIGQRLTLKVAAERAEMYWRSWQKVEAAAIPVTLWMVAQVSCALGVDPEELIRAA